MLLSIAGAINGLTGLSHILSTALTDAVLESKKPGSPLELRQLLSATARIKKTLDVDGRKLKEAGYGDEGGGEAVTVRHVAAIVTSAVRVYEELIVKLENGGAPETLIGLVRDMEVVERGLKLLTLEGTQEASCTEVAEVLDTLIFELDAYIAEFNTWAASTLFCDSTDRRAFEEARDHSDTNSTKSSASARETLRNLKGTLFKSKSSRLSLPLPLPLHAHGEQAAKTMWQSLECLKYSTVTARQLAIPLEPKNIPHTSDSYSFDLPNGNTDHQLLEAIMGSPTDDTEEPNGFKRFFQLIRGFNDSSPSDYSCEFPQAMVHNPTAGFLLTYETPTTQTLFYGQLPVEMAAEWNNIFIKDTSVRPPSFLAKQHLPLAPHNQFWKWEKAGADLAELRKLVKALEKEKRQMLLYLLSALRYKVEQGEEVAEVAVKFASCVFGEEGGAKTVETLVLGVVQLLQEESDAKDEKAEVKVQQVHFKDNKVEGVGLTVEGKGTGTTRKVQTLLALSETRLHAIRHVSVAPGQKVGGLPEAWENKVEC